MHATRRLSLFVQTPTTINLKNYELFNDLSSQFKKRSRETRHYETPREKNPLWRLNDLYCSLLKRGTKTNKYAIPIWNTRKGDTESPCYWHRPKPIIFWEQLCYHRTYCATLCERMKVILVPGKFRCGEYDDANQNLYRNPLLRHLMVSLFEYESTERSRSRGRILTDCLLSTVKKAREKRLEKRSWRACDASADLS